MRETEGEPAEIAGQITPSLDLIFDLLSTRRRRYALYYLHERPDGVATIEEIADAVVAFQHGDSDTEPQMANLETETEAKADSDPEEQRLQVHMELQHTHLPKLEEAGVLEHDQRSETVRYWGQPSLEEWLEHAYHKERS